MDTKEDRLKYLESLASDEEYHKLLACLVHLEVCLTFHIICLPWLSFTL
jgi:hypothetical protein